MRKILFAAIIIAVFSMIVLFGNICFVSAHSTQNHTMTVEVDLVGFGAGNETGEISIEVPDLIDLGEVSPSNLVSNEESFIISNNGTVNVTVTPQLKDSDEEIFKWLYFRNYQSSSVHPEQAIPRKMGDYSINIEKPAAGKNGRSKNTYIRLNLTDFSGTIRENVNNYRADIIFLAMPSS